MLRKNVECQIYQMSYDSYICLLKVLQTKPLSINIDRKGVKFVVFAFSKYHVPSMTPTDPNIRPRP
jgi:hypothetical protein